MRSAFQVQIVGDNGQALDDDFRHERDPSAKALLKGLQIRLEPARFPKIGLLLEADYARVGYFPSRKGRLPMVGRAALCPLRQFQKLASENVIEAQLASNLLGDVALLRPIRIDVNLLKKEDIGLRVAQEIDDLRQLQSAVDVPIHNSNR